MEILEQNLLRRQGEKNSLGTSTPYGETKSNCERAQAETVVNERTLCRPGTGPGNGKSE